MKNKFAHLEKRIEKGFDWKSNLLKKTLPKRAWDNRLTANIMLSIERILVNGFSTADKIREYMRF
jgi:hypothetical protein